MKAFKKWWLMEAQNIVGVGRCTEKEAAEAGYRRALEEVFKQIEQSVEQPYLTLQYLIGRIKKELKRPECITCDDTKQVGEEIIHEGRSMGWKECPNCVGKGNGK